MNKIILNNGSEIEFSEAYGIDRMVIKNKTVEELESMLTKENLEKIDITTINGEINGKYENLECVSITKYLEDSSIVIELRQI